MRKKASSSKVDRLEAKILLVSLIALWQTTQSHDPCNIVFVLFCFVLFFLFLGFSAIARSFSLNREGSFDPLKYFIF